MLLEFTCTNYKSIKNKVVLSLLASTDDTFENDLILYDKFRINRLSALYGPNGSGKTTVLNALLSARRIILGSMKREIGDSLQIISHKLSSSDVPTEFTFQYVMDGIRYAYGFSVLNDKIDEEYLYYFPNRRQTKVFSRKGLEVDGGDSFKKFGESAFEVLKDNRLFLSCIANYSNNSYVENAFLFFKNYLKAYKADADSQSTTRAIEFMANHPELKETYLKIVGYLNTGIKDINATVRTRKFTDDDLPDDFPDDLKSIILGSEGRKMVKAQLDYGLFTTDLAAEESTGVKKLFEFLYPLIECLKNGRVLICDEIETGLHESIVCDILRLFLRIYPDMNAQLIFTTHDTSLLDEDLFRRDQIWFTELDEQRSTVLYSLAEIKNVRKTENLKKGYISGKYGAIPMMNPAMLSSLVLALNDEIHSSLNESTEE